MKIQNPLYTSSSTSLFATSASRTLLAAATVAVLTLAGCASGGNPNGDTTPSLSANNNPGAVPAGNVAGGGDNVVAQTGRTVGDLDTAVGMVPVPVIGDTAAQKNLGATVTSAGNAVQTSGGGISNGLGKIDSTPDLIGTTVQSSGDVIRSAGVTVSNTGQIISDLGAAGSPLVPLNPVMSPAGNGVPALGQVMQGTGGLVTIGTSSGPVQQIMQQMNNAVVPLSSQLVNDTQTVGSTTMLGGPLADALNTVGGGLQSAGTQVGAADGNPFTRDVGGAVGTAGGTVASAGGLVNGSSGGSANPLAPITGVLGGDLGGGSNPLAPVTDMLSGGGSNPLAPVTGALTDVAGSGNPLAPITNAPGGVTNAAGGSGSNPLSPLIGALSAH